MFILFVIGIWKYQNVISHQEIYFMYIEILLNVGKEYKESFDSWPSVQK